MADNPSQLVLDALHRAAVDPAGVPLFGPKSAPGIFGGTAKARQAAQRCKELDLLRVVRTEQRGKSTQEVVVITPRGLDHLLGASDVGELLGDLVRAVEGRERQLAEMLAAAQSAQASLQALKNLAAEVMRKLQAQQTPASRGPALNSYPEAIASILQNWHKSEPAKDCPLPHLFSQMADLTIGQFHDGLRQLQAEDRIYLHPWTGPLSEIPEPRMALMAGHEVAYYASWREQ